jgi:N-acetylmuramoyl-L-alanine amidase
MKILAMNNRFTHRLNFRRALFLPVVLLAGLCVEMGVEIAAPARLGSALAQERPRNNGNGAPTETPSQPAGVRPSLTVGDRNESVSELQAMLKLLGYYTGTVDGVFQDSTATAVSTFQRAAGLTADGVAGTATWNRLLPASNTASAPVTPSPRPSVTPAPATPSPSVTPAPVTPPQPTTVDFPVLRSGLRGAAVSTLQQRLRRLGFFDGAVDGVFGGETEDAVKAAQQNLGLEADGVVGAATWDALLQ